eukprot:6485787-Amphidinium_carterae.3
MMVLYGVVFVCQVHIHHIIYQHLKQHNFQHSHHLIYDHQHLGYTTSSTIDICVYHHLKQHYIPAPQAAHLPGLLNK